MKRLKKNSELFEIEVDGEKEKRLVYGKGRNSVAQKVFGMRAYPAMQSGIAKSITRITKKELRLTA